MEHLYSDQAFIRHIFVKYTQRIKSFFISLFTTLQSSEKETQSFLHIVNSKCKTPPLAAFSPHTVGYSKKTTTTTYFALSRFLKQHLIYSPYHHIRLHFLQPINELMFILEVPVQPLNTRYLSAPRWMRRVERWLFQLQINVLQHSSPSSRINLLICSLINV